MSDLYDETPGKQVIFIRFNPDVYKSDGTPLIPKGDERFKLLLDVLKAVTSKTMSTSLLMSAIYICYSKDNKVLCNETHLTRKMIYSTKDIVSCYDNCAYYVKSTCSVDSNVDVQGTRGKAVDAFEPKKQKTAASDISDKILKLGKNKK